MLITWNDAIDFDAVVVDVDVVYVYVILELKFIYLFDTNMFKLSMNISSTLKNLEMFPNP